MSNPTTTPNVRQPHPRGLMPMFFTEMWERFSYYGMRAMLVLYLLDNVRGGKGLSKEVATAIYGLYTASAYLMPLIGGWVADRFIGAQKAIWYGGIVILMGHVTLAISHGDGFYFGLALIVLGTGLLKPNVSVIIGELYPEGGARRDAGFTIYYMSVNLGAAIGPLISSYLGEKFNWHYGFGAAAVGMLLGLIQFRLSLKTLGECGRHPGHRGASTSNDKILLGAVLTGVALVLTLPWLGLIQINPVLLASRTSYVIAGVAILYFTTAFLFLNLTHQEKQRLGIIALLFLASVMFWSGFEQAGSSFNLFAQDYTQRVFGTFQIPTGWFQTLNPICVITLAPLVAMVWVRLARRNRDLTLNNKFAMGLFLLAAGFVVMAAASKLVGNGNKVLPTWLIATYFIHSVGELCLSPVGLSSVTKLAPRRLVGQMLGFWYLANSLANLIAGLIAGKLSAGTPAEMSGLYMQIVFMSVGVGGFLLLFTKPIKSIMKGIE